MGDDPNRVVVLTRVPTELHAAMIVAALDARGVQAQAAGALTSGFRAEAPGGVQILVRHCDLEQARLALQAIEEEIDPS